MQGLPELIIHPGFPKCASSTLQWAFVVDEHALSRQMGASFIGKEFLPMNGYPPVAELMYERDKCLEQIKSQKYTSGKYFLSSEALINDVQFVKNLSAKFQITKVVFVVRFPPEQALSAYRFSGWLTNDPSDLVSDTRISILNALNRHANCVRRYSTLYNTSLCPLEAPELLSRFCEACFGQSPLSADGSSYSKNVTSNKSTSLGFAMALRNEIVARKLKFTNYERRRIVRIVKKWKLSEELKNLNPNSSFVHQLSKGIDFIDSYKSLLLDYKVDPETVSLVIENARSRFEDQISKPIASTSQMVDLSLNAKALLDGALSD